MKQRPASGYRGECGKAACGWGGAGGRGGGKDEVTFLLHEPVTVPGKAGHVFSHRCASTHDLAERRARPLGP